ncbi:MAG: glucose-6-phosphate isomerase [Gemmatimonadales bacterium]
MSSAFSSGEARRALISRIWKRDPTVWSEDASTPEISNRLGWLTVPEDMADQIDALEKFARVVRAEFESVVLLGMGGSSLAPLVLHRTFGSADGFPAFTVLDSTHPEAIHAVDEATPPDGTLFIVASKSGTTLETRSLLEHYWDMTEGRGSQFVAITDRDTPLAKLSDQRQFGRTFINPTDIGGRYSALSLFGLVPAATMGIDIARLIRRAGKMAEECRRTDLDENPGAVLGTLMGEAVLAGRDRLTLLLSSRIASFGLWVEQLVAESTGKAGKGILPLTSVEVEPYGEESDRLLFIGVDLLDSDRALLRASREQMATSDHPATVLELMDPYDLGGEFFRWCFAIAFAGAVLGVNPFDQPNVAESKSNTQRVLEGPTEAPTAYAAPREIERFLERVEPGAYLSLMAYLPPTEDNDQRLERVRLALENRLGVAVTTGYGPRLLHSTGQLHKGGPATGHFVQILNPSFDHDVSVPGKHYTFGRLLTAQADGDFEALRARGRPIVRVPSAEELLEVAT